MAKAKLEAQLRNFCNLRNCGSCPALSYFFSKRYALSAVLLVKKLSDALNCAAHQEKKKITCALLRCASKIKQINSTLFRYALCSPILLKRNLL